MNKLEKLKELGELLKSNAINDIEFETLKHEVLFSDDNAVLQNEALKNSKKVDLEKERIQLKSFKDNNDKLIESPKLEYINFKDIINDEIKLIKPFLRLKQMHAPEDMTQDEIVLGEKLFSTSEILQINSERSGFNYVTSSFFSVITALGCLLLIVFHPLLIFITGFLTVGVIITGLTTLNRLDSTKLDKRAVYLSFVLIGSGFIIYKLTI